MGNPFIILLRIVGACRLVSLLLLLLASIVTYLSIRPPSFSSLPLSDQRFAELLKTTVRLEPTISTLNGTEYIWQIPHGAKNVVFMAHGCNQNAMHWWDSSKGCPQCIGLPEHRILVKAALARKYAVITISSSGPCWGTTWPPEKSVDMEPVLAVLDTWRINHNVTSLPLVALGVSSGGYFVSMLPHKTLIASLVIVVASGIPEAFEVPLEGGQQFPPTQFVHMVKDVNTARAVRGSVLGLRRVRSESNEIPCWHQPVTASFLSQRIEQLSFWTARKLVRVFNEAGMLDMKGYLKKDAILQWQKKIREYRYRFLASVGEKLELEDEIEQVLNVAYGFHEVTSRYAQEMFDWFDGVCVTEMAVEKNRCGTLVVSPTDSKQE